MQTLQLKAIIKKILFVFILGLSLVSCNENNKKIKKDSDEFLYASSGRTSEILIVISEKLWKSPLGDSIKASLQSTPAWMARITPEYDITHIPYEAFGSVYQKERNILFIKKENIKKPKVALRTNVYAQPQALITIQAKTEAELIKAFDKYQNKIKTTFHQNEIKRIEAAYKGLEVKTLAEKLDKKFGFHLVFPKGFYLAADKADFAWLRRPTSEVEEGVLIYTRPYVDTTQFEEQHIIDYRNEITKKYIPGPVEGSYMKVSSIFPPVYKVTTFEGSYAVELRSWWDVKGYPMGGPFISYTFIDKAAGRLITIDGYIKAPKKGKRDLLLHIEALLNSFTYEKPTKSTKTK